LGRSHAHHLVQALCVKAIEQHRPLFDILAETPEVTRHVDGDALRRLCDPTRYLGLSAEMVDRVVAKLR
jgi:3-carboxy-cis,cis-muconate cycloisomerase